MMLANPVVPNPAPVVYRSQQPTLTSMMMLTVPLVKMMKKKSAVCVVDCPLPTLEIVSKLLGGESATYAITGYIWHFVLRKGQSGDTVNSCAHTVKPRLSIQRSILIISQAFCYVFYLCFYKFVTLTQLNSFTVITDVSDIQTKFEETGLLISMK